MAISFNFNTAINGAINQIDRHVASCFKTVAVKLPIGENMTSEVLSFTIIPHYVAVQINSVVHTLDNLVFEGNYSNTVIKVNGNYSEIIVSNIVAHKTQKESIYITNANNALIENCIFDGIGYATTPLGGIVMQDCLNGTIRNTRIWNSGNQVTFPAIYFRGIGSIRNYSVEQCSFSGPGFIGNFEVQIQDDDVNSTIAGIGSEIIRYNRFEILAPELQIYGRGQILGNQSLGGMVGKLPIALTFSNSVPLVLPYKLDTGNHAVEVFVSGRNITANMPFVAKIVLMNCDDGVGHHPSDAQIIYSKNAPGNLGLAYNNALQNWTLTLDSGTVNNCWATISGNGVYSTSFGN